MIIKNHPIFATWLLCLGSFLSSNLWAEQCNTSVDDTLYQLHRAAAQAEGEVYFQLFTADAYYIGTDANETWTLKEFKQFAKPYLDNGRGWLYEVKQRHVTLHDKNGTAWFVELLNNDKYGTSRGSGVLLKEQGCWKIAQYHLAFPIPNAIAAELTAKIKAYEKKNEH